MRTRDEMISELRVMLHDMLAASASGARGARLARAHGYVDGYMRVMLDLQVSTKAELFAVVAAERKCFAGPVLRVLERPDQDEAVAQAV